MGLHVPSKTLSDFVLSAGHCSCLKTISFKITERFVDILLDNGRNFEQYILALMNNTLDNDIQLTGIHFLGIGNERTSHNLPYLLLC